MFREHMGFNDTLIPLQLAYMHVMQGTIIDADMRIGEPSFLVIEPHKGYPFPIKGHRITCFDPETGILKAHYQDPVVAVEQLAEDRIKVTFNENFGQLYGPETAKAVHPGSLICLEARFFTSSCMRS